MEKLMLYLNKKFVFLTESKIFTVFTPILIYLNPVALLPQVITVLNTENVAGISFWMWVVFALIQLAFVFEGIKNKNATIFLSMFISFIESVIILTVVFIKG